jgi:dipeptidyl aminopeptidase/acylaminoacyl peptidase
MRTLFPILCLFLTALDSVVAQSAYKRPPADVAAIVDAKPTPTVNINPTRDAVLLTEYTFYPGIATLAKPFLKLAGLRIDPQLNARQRITEYTGLKVQWIQENKTITVELPSSGKLGATYWSPDGKKIAFLLDTDKGVELWLADARTGKSRRLGDFHLNEVLGGPVFWMEDSQRLCARLIPAGRGPAPDANPVPEGPNVEETAGKLSQVWTYQDLLRTENDERLFEYYGTSQPALVDIGTGRIEKIGAPALYTSISTSPDENYWLVTTLRRPFSYRVPYNLFSRKTEIWDKNSRPLRSIVEYPVSDEIPRQGVIDGPREFAWQAHYPARLLWAQALDGGDPKRKVDFRDKIMMLEAPFGAEPRELLQTKHRYAGIQPLAAKDRVLLAEYDRDRRWATTYNTDLSNPAEKQVVFDLSVNDDYKDPGNPVYERLPNGDWVIAQEGDDVFFNSKGASPEGMFPRLDKINLKTGKKTTVFESSKNAFEEFVAFAGSDRSRFVTRFQNKTAPPNYFLNGPKPENRRAMTDFKDPHPQLTGVEKRLVKYKRKDGVALSGTLYLPPNHTPGRRLPLFIWAYPLEYNDAATAGQVRGSENTFTYFQGATPLFFLTQGYAVLMDATMPVVGDPETVNNTFVEQVTGSGRAAIDHLDSLGIIDRNRVGVGGHSYGAFMTASLLAHSDDYAFGVARSGAYNRTLTPFGFQGERRSFWEAKDTYMNISPFTHADKINEPLLIIHGEADNNPGTHTMQSERLFQAIKGNGGSARLVLLPHESHGYRAKESILHVLAEAIEWSKKHGARRTP